jgi:tetratricopeptide (TPR) repeat protein
MALALASCSSRDKTAANAAADAQTAFQQGRNAAALRSIHEALAARDDVSDYWLLLGRISAATNDLPGAFDAYENVIELDRGNVEALRLLCQLGLAVKAPDKVDKYADQLLLLTPGDALPLVMKGGAALQRGDSNGALGFAEQVLAKDPQNSGALILKGRVLAARGDFAGAASFIEGSPGSANDDSGRLTFLKELYVQAHDRQHYQITLKRLAAEKPGDADRQLAYADLLYQTGQAPTANAVVVQQTRRHPNDIGVAAKIVDVWLKQGPEALTTQQIMTQAANASLQMKSAYARFANETGRPDIAIAILPRDLAGATPDLTNADAMAARAYAMGLLGHRLDAIARLDEILEIDAVHPGALLARARLKAIGKDVTGAITDVRRVVADDAHNVTARLALVDFLLMRGDVDLARSALRESVRALPEEPRLAARLAEFLQKSGDKEGALSVARNLVRAAPVSLRALRVRAALDPSAPTDWDTIPPSAISPPAGQ